MKSKHLGLLILNTAQWYLSTLDSQANLKLALQSLQQWIHLIILPFQNLPVKDLTETEPFSSSTEPDTICNH